MGPLIDKASVVRVDAAVHAAIDAGAEVIIRGGPSTRPELDGGASYHPTLLEVTDVSLPIVQEETFGPVQTIQVFDTEDGAAALANRSEYGLSACIWSRDVDTPMRVARRLEGGFKSTGAGRLGGVASLDDFVESKQITRDYA